MDKPKPKSKYAPAGRKLRLTDNPKVLARASAKRLSDVLVVTGVGNPAYKVLMPAQMKQLNVDESYQRIRIKSEVNTLIHVLTQGGDVSDPITVANRPDGTLWIVDGQQRYWAHAETNTPLKALIYPVDDVEAERKLYVASNTRVKVGTNYMVKAWAGIGAEILAKLAEVPGSEVEGMVDFGTDKKRPLAAAAAIRAMVVVSTGVMDSGQGGIQNVLARLDKELEHNMAARDRADGLLRLACTVFSPKERIPLMPLNALALVANRRWNGRSKPVPPATLKKLQRMNWSAIIGGHYVSRFMPILVQAIERAWPA